MLNLSPLALLIASLLLLPVVSMAQNLGNQSQQSFKKKIQITVSAKYLLYLPVDYGRDKKKRWPLIVFLHGSGESGDNLDIVAKHGPPQLIAEGKEFPFIIVSPQARSADRGWDNDMLNALLDTIMKNNRVDKDRVYLTGLSMGGYGTWSFAIAHPDRFAAIAPVSAGGNASKVYKLKDVPVWVFHGALDTTVPLQEDQNMADALKKAGGNVKFTIYPDLGHDCWTQTYENQKLYDWFLKHKLAK